MTAVDTRDHGNEAEEVAGHPLAAFNAETVLVHTDDAAGLRCIISLHDTRLGPGLGGTRMRPYPTFAEALQDVLGLARAMAYKNALAGLPHGGGKAIIVGRPDRHKTPTLLRAYGRAVQSLAGRYVTACDVGTTVADMDLVAQTCDFVTGRSVEHGGAGDSGALTAYGVHVAMRACAEHRWGSASLLGCRVGVVGLGKVGSRLVDGLVADGAHVWVADIDPAAAGRVLTRHPGVRVVDHPDAMLDLPLEIYSPNALGGVLSVATARRLAADVVCGGANTQLADPSAAIVLADRGVLYAPDYVVNAGGVIQVADELDGFDFERARRRAARIGDTLLEILQRAEERGILPLQAADQVAEARMAAGSWRWEPPRSAG